MRKANFSSLFIAAALAAIPSMTRAQAFLEVGAYAGGTSTTMYQSFDCPPPTDPIDVCASGSEPHEGAHGASFGAYLRYPLLRAVMVEANFMYAQKGYDVSPKVRMHYLEAPILVRLDPLADLSRARVFAYAGLAPTLHLWCRAKGTRFDNETREVLPYADSCGDWPFEPHTPNRIDLGGVIGGGVGWKFPFGVAELQARYNEGLIDNGTGGDGGKTVNRPFYVIAGYGATLRLP